MNRWSKCRPISAPACLPTNTSLPNRETGSPAQKFLEGLLKCPGIGKSENRTKTRHVRNRCEANIFPVKPIKSPLPCQEQDPDSAGIKIGTPARREFPGIPKRQCPIVSWHTSSRLRLCFTLSFEVLSSAPECPAPQDRIGIGMSENVMDGSGSDEKQLGGLLKQTRLNVHDHGLTQRHDCPKGGKYCGRTRWTRGKNGLGLLRELRHNAPTSNGFKSLLGTGPRYAGIDITGG